jgi:hypothetical protein
MSWARAILAASVWLLACRPAAAPALPADAPEVFLPDRAMAVLRIPDLDRLRGSAAGTWLVERLSALSRTTDDRLATAAAAAQWSGPVSLGLYLDAAAGSAGSAVHVATNVAVCARSAGRDPAAFEAALEAWRPGADLPVEGVTARARPGILSARAGDAWVAVVGPAPQPRLASSLRLARGQDAERALSGSQSFLVAAAQVPPAPDDLATLVADLAAGVDFLLDAAPRESGLALLVRQLESLQLRTLRSLTATFTADGPTTRVRSVLALSRDRVGFAGLFDRQPAPLRLPGLLPDSVLAGTFVLCRWNFLPLMESVEAAGSSMIGDTGRNPVQVVQSLLGLNLRDDVVKKLTGEVLVVDVPEATAGGGGGDGQVPALLRGRCLLVGMVPEHGLDERVSRILRTREFGKRQVVPGGEVWRIPADNPQATLALGDEFIAVAPGDASAFLKSLLAGAAEAAPQRAAWTWPPEILSLLGRAGATGPEACIGIGWNAGRSVRGVQVPTAAGVSTLVEF